jgi:cation:H+ antiporter
VFGVFVSYLIKKSITKDDKNKEKPKYRLSSSFLLIIMGLLSLFIGSDLVVDSVESIAEAFHISQRIISLTVVTIGTSLPEIITAIIASKKNETEILLGNIIGSNIFNICIVLGIPILIYGNVMHITVNILDISMSLLSAGLLFVFSYFDRTITRVNGIIMILLYLLYFSLILII